MDIAGTNILWKDYDVDALPLNTSALSDKSDGDIRISEYYFDGYATVDGRVRAYIKVCEPPKARGVILYMPDVSGDDHGDVDALVKRGYTVAALDYLGTDDKQPRFTIYPKSLAACNSRNKNEFVASEDSLSSSWYIWTCIARKAIRLLVKQYPEKKIFAIGRGLGGSTVYKLCAFRDGLTAATTLLSVLPDVKGEGNRLINYRAALDNTAYAKITSVPLFMALSSNDEDGSLDEMSALAAETRSLSCFRIVERAFSGGIRVVHDQIANFFNAYISNTPKIPRVKLKLKNSENKLYFNIHLDGLESDFESKVTKVQLFAAFCIANPTHRNWANIKTLGLSEGEYIARADVLQVDKPVYAYVNAADEYGNVISSEVVSVIPKALGIPAQSYVRRRLIYDGSMGKDVWTSPDGGNVLTKAGPMGIDGVTSDKHMLATFKPGDMLYHANGDALLQVLISGKPQTITVEVNDEKNVYTCDLEIPSGDDWHKFTLSHLDFKGANGPLNDWSNVIVLGFTSEEEIIISSVLWV